MAEKCELKRAHGCLQLSGVIDFNTAPELYSRILEEIRGQSDVILDFAGVTRSNSAALGLILELLSRKDRGLHFRFRHLPASLRDLAHMSSLDELLDRYIDQ